VRRARSRRSGPRRRWGVLRNQDDYTKNRNYWKYLKDKLKKENNEGFSISELTDCIIAGLSKIED
jgi:hypothetical protein